MVEYIILKNDLKKLYIESSRDVDGELSFVFPNISFIESSNVTYDDLSSGQ
jgi:hypothetical protein